MTPRRRAPFLLKRQEKKVLGNLVNGELLAVRGRQKIGYVTYVLVPKGPNQKSQARISYVNVNPAHQRTGIASKMLETIEKKVDTVVVLDVKGPILKLLAKRGYKIQRDPEEGFWAIKEKR